ncbi:MAG: RNase P subunit p30 family protein [Euryarchaeota archaeon]|jgi:ribonuclease P/MRP protein subunit RPP1|nr:RNase P subunit p30 family protein [Euryarchaeota archaeon]
MFIDLHVHYYPGITIDAWKMGYQGLVLVRSSEESPSNLKGSKKLLINNKNSDTHGTDLSSKISTFEGVEIRAKNPEDLKRKIQKFRMRTDVLLVHGGDLKVNRAAVEDPRVDVLAHPYRGRRDSGFNHVLAKKAAENNVAVEINIGYLLRNRNHRRQKVLAQFRELVKLKSKFHFPMVITTGARSLYDLRSPLDLMALSKCFGMDKESSFFALSTVPKAITVNSQLKHNLISSGVRLLE